MKNKFIEEPKIQDVYRCKGCGAEFNLKNVPEKAYHFEFEEYYWVCLNCKYPNTSIIYKL